MSDIDKSVPYLCRKVFTMRYLSNGAIQNEIRDGMQSQDIDENELAERIGISAEELRTMLSNGYDFSVFEIQSVFEALDLSLRFDVVTF